MISSWLPMRRSGLRREGPAGPAVEEDEAVAPKVHAASRSLPSTTSSDGPQNKTADDDDAAAAALAPPPSAEDAVTAAVLIHPLLTRSRPGACKT